MDTRIKEMLGTAVWQESEITKSGDVLKCQIDGEVMEGEVRIHPKEISVRVLKDGIELTASAKLMLMAPVTYTTGAGTHVANDRCVMRIKQLMVGLYHDYRKIMDNREQIKVLLPVFLKAKEECNSAAEALNTKKRDLKKDFREGRLSQKSYMEQLSCLKKEISAQQENQTIAFHKIFSPVLSECTHCDNLIKIVETLPFL